MIIKWLFIVGFVSCSQFTFAQQLIVIRKNTVLARCHVGQRITYAAQGKKGFTNDFVIGLTDSSLMTRSDTVSILAISKLKLQHKAERNFQLTASAHKLIAIGILLPIGEYIAITAVQDLAYEFSSAVGIVSAALVTTGVIMLIAARPMVKINRKNRIRVVDYRSVLYR